MLTVVLPSAFAAIRQLLSPGLRRILFRSLGFTLLCLGLLWYGLTQGLRALLAAYPVGSGYPMLEGVLVFMAGAGLLVGLVYVLPIVSAFVAGFFLDDAAAIIEASDFPGEPAGRPLPLSRSIWFGVSFAGLALLVNLVALMLILVPGVNLVAFFAANAYLLGREYFEMAAARFRPVEAAGRLRREHRATIVAAGALMAAMMLVPILNLAVPIFGIALMVHVNKRIAARLPPPL